MNHAYSRQLRSYAHAKKINKEDTSLFLKDMLWVPIIKQFEKYLSLSSFVGQLQNKTVTELKETGMDKIERLEGMRLI